MTKDAHSEAVTAATDALATYRLTRLLIQDEITEPIRTRIFARFGEPYESKISYLATCPWCISIYIGAGVALARRYGVPTWSTAARALALSALTGILTERT